MEQFINSDRELFHEIHLCFNIARQLIQDNRDLYESIDEAYETVLLQDLSLVPEQYDFEVLRTIRSIKIVLANINYSAIAKGIDNVYDGILHFNINTYEEFKKALEKIEMTKKDRIRILNLVSKFKPLFSIIDLIINEPLVYIRKVAQLSTNQYSDIF